MKDQYVDIPPELMGKADPDQQWIEAQLDRIDPWRHEQGHDGADTAALRKLVLEQRDKLKKLSPPEETWRDDTPPKRGAYRVRRVGGASTNYGYAYWTGDRWGAMCSSRAYAQEMKGAGRKTPSRYPMQWLQKGGAA